VRGAGQPAFVANERISRRRRRWQDQEVEDQEQRQEDGSVNRQPDEGDPLP
jgi:hypothetical protein